MNFCKNNTVDFFISMYVCVSHCNVFFDEHAFINQFKGRLTHPLCCSLSYPGNI